MHKDFEVILAHARHLVFLAVCFALGPVGSGIAQADDNPSAGLDEQYEDWTVQCAEATDAVICTMVQDVRQQGQSERIMSARVDLVTSDTPRLTLIVPLGLDLAAGIGVYPGSSETAIASVSPRVCQHSECYAFLPMTPDFQEAVADSIALRLRMTPFNAQAREVPLSLRGFSEALDRLHDLQ